MNGDCTVPSRISPSRKLVGNVVVERVIAAGPVPERLGLVVTAPLSNRSTIIPSHWLLVAGWLTAEGFLSRLSLHT